MGRRVLFERADPRQRHEILGCLGDYIHTPASAALLHDVILDIRTPEDEHDFVYEELCRASAVGGLRRMSNRAQRSGGSRTVFQPKKTTIVPFPLSWIIDAANDPSARVRRSAVYALADTRSPDALPELRKHLTDTDFDVRILAACLLTEYNDASGLTVMREALSRLRKQVPNMIEFTYWYNVERLLYSLERITGKSFGEIPMNPIISSQMPGKGEKEYMALLDAWIAWWEWEPNE